VDISNEELNKRFNVGDYAQIMQTQDRTDEGIGVMICKLIKKCATDFGCDVYEAELNISWFKPKIIKISAAEINPMDIDKIASLCNTLIYFRDKRKVSGLIKKLNKEV